MLPFVSIIIPTYNRGNLIKSTIESLLKQSYPTHKFEIIIANNNSTDNSEKILDRYSADYNNIKVLNVKKQGVHYARNNAANIARGDLLYFTDDDMIADEFMLEEIVKVFSLDPLIGTATGLIKPKFEIDPPEWVKKYMINSLLSLTDKNRYEEIIVSKKDIGVYSCHQAIKREVFFESGGFNPENTAGVWIGDGETGLNIKIARLGYKFAYTCKSIVYHIIPSDRTTLRYLIKRLGNQGFCDAYTFYRRHRNKKDILKFLVRRNTFELLTRILYTLAKICYGKLSWHFIPAILNYYYKWTIYDLRLLKDPEFCQFVEIDDWINYGRA